MSIKKNLIRKLFKIHDSLNRRIENRFPLLSLYLYYKPRKYLQFRKERLYLKGKFFSKSEEQSIIFFTVHKSASVFINNLISSLIANKGLIHLDLDGYFSSTDRKKYKIYKDQKILESIFNEKGYYYGAFRSFRNIPNIDKYKIILVLRDPRDILVSHYYSISYSHALVNKNVYKKRKEALKQDINEFVIQHAPRFKKTLQEYSKNLYQRNNVLFLKYEDMIYDLKTWVYRIAEFLDCQMNQNIHHIIKNTTQVNAVKKENIYSHARKKTPGDYKNKLNQETINYLNNYFSEELDFFEFH